MKTLKFKSNIKCSSCIAKVAGVLNATEGINKWEVDIYTPEKILTVETDHLEPSDIQEAIERAGYKAVPVASDQG
jgi:copper chaperone